MIQRILINKSNYEVFEDIIRLVKERKIERFRMSRRYNAYGVEYTECEHNDKADVEDLLEILETIEIGDTSVQKFYIFYDIENDGIIYNVEKRIVKEIQEVKVNDTQEVTINFETCREYLKSLGIDVLPFKQGKKNSSVSVDVIFDSIETKVKEKTK